MSLIFYVVRNKQNRSQFYQSRTKGLGRSGWVDNIYKASIYSNMTGPSQVKKIIGEDRFELVMINGTLRDGTYKSVYIIRNKFNGEYITNKNMRKKKEMFSTNFKHADTWTSASHAKSLIRAYSKTNPTGILLNPDDLEVIHMPVFIPDVEKL